MPENMPSPKIVGMPLKCSSCVWNDDCGDPDTIATLCPSFCQVNHERLLRK